MPSAAPSAISDAWLVPQAVAQESMPWGAIQLVQQVAAQTSNSCWTMGVQLLSGSSAARRQLRPRGPIGSLDFVES